MARLALDTFYTHIIFGISRFSRSEDMIVGVQIENGLCDPKWFVICKLRYDIVYLCIKFDVSSFNRSRVIRDHLVTKI